MGDRLRRLACGTRKRFLKFELRRLFYSWPGQPLELFELKSNTRLPIGVVETFGAQFQVQRSDGSQTCVRDTTSASLKPGDRVMVPYCGANLSPPCATVYTMRGAARRFANFADFARRWVGFAIPLFFTFESVPL